MVQIVWYSKMLFWHGPWVQWGPGSHMWVQLAHGYFSKAVCVLPLSKLTYFQHMSKNWNYFSLFGCGQKLGTRKQTTQQKYCLKKILKIPLSKTKKTTLRLSNSSRLGHAEAWSISASRSFFFACSRVKCWAKTHRLVQKGNLTWSQRAFIEKAGPNVDNCDDENIPRENRRALPFHPLSILSKQRSFDSVKKRARTPGVLQNVQNAWAAPSPLPLQPLFGHFSPLCHFSNTREINARASSAHQTTPLFLLWTENGSPAVCMRSKLPNLFAILVFTLRHVETKWPEAFPWLWFNQNPWAHH